MQARSLQEVIELAGTTPGTEYDRLQVSNEVTLGGSLRFDLLDGFLPAAGDVYTFLSNLTFAR